ncbi:MAG: RidA family protein [Chloroflexi bacterium]|nr:RidA family protein [Chloroflexota bacterium]
MKKEFIQPKGLYVPETYSHAVKVGNTVYVAGTVGRDNQQKVVEGGFEAQAVKAFENIKIILEAAGASYKDIVKLNIYITNMDNIGKLREIRMRYFSRPLPATTAVEVSRLAPGVLLEMEAVAMID